MRQINFNSKLNKGDWILIKKQKTSFNDLYVELVGVVRNYDNLKSLSGVIEKFYRNYKISGVINEYPDYRVFAWYKKGFVVLCDVEFSNNITLEDEEGNKVNYVKIYKLNKKEINKFNWHMIKLKMLKILEGK